MGARTIRPKNPMNSLRFGCRLPKMSPLKENRFPNSRNPRYAPVQEQREPGEESLHGQKLEQALAEPWLNPDCSV